MAERELESKKPSSTVPALNLRAIAPLTVGTEVFENLVINRAVNPAPLSCETTNEAHREVKGYIGGGVHLDQRDRESFWEAEPLRKDLG